VKCEKLSLIKRNVSRKTGRNVETLKGVVLEGDFVKIIQACFSGLNGSNQENAYEIKKEFR